MAKQTIELSEEEMNIINAVKGVLGVNNIKDTVSFIIKDYGKKESYSKFIKEKRGGIKREKKWPITQR